MEFDIQALIDHHCIRQLLADYCRGCDRLDHKLMLASYARDSWDDHGDLKCSGPEFVDKTITRLGRDIEMCSHQLGQSRIDVRGDEAGAETYFTVSIRRRSRSGTEVLDQMGGRYVDDLVREDGVWKIKRRQCVRDWSTSHKIHDWLTGFDFIEGERSPNDISYGALRS